MYSAGPNGTFRRATFRRFACDGRLGFSSSKDPIFVLLNYKARVEMRYDEEDRCEDLNLEVDGIDRGEWAAAGSPRPSDSS